MTTTTMSFGIGFTSSKIRTLDLSKRGNHGIPGPCTQHLDKGDTGQRRSEQRSMKLFQENVSNTMHYSTDIARLRRIDSSR